MPVFSLPELERQVCACLPDAIARAFRDCASAPGRSGSELRVGIDEYLHRLEIGPTTNEFVDLLSARAVAEKCLFLLAATADRGTEEQCLARVAAEYFLAEDDEEHDTGSIIGFDDDLAVVNAVAEVLRVRKGVGQ